MSIERPMPPVDANERDMLEGWLDFHRSTLALKCEGLTDSRLRVAAVPPSEMSLLGLVRHMADVERHWYRRVLAGEDHPPLHYTDDDPDGDFHAARTDTWERAYAVWQGEIAAARTVAAEFRLDEPSRGRHRRTGLQSTLRWIHTHMIEEYARHNGHADLIRECLDGTTGV
ncbi:MULTISPECIES: DinB family protein [unclassified Streptomyces]|uniref:DinB family protein n=1 Tax=unclassified Streptomyces TaxID=2593676 RepID=UPI0022384F25|nr:DinB family protein [Streptomyces sp. SHP 1-2]MCW5253700.1 DinB family protein [Streptomyces sp. SHP 1-2]